MSDTPEKDQEPQTETPQTEETSQDAQASGPFPEPTLTMLASSLYLQGMISLGLYPSPVTGKTEVSIHQAKHTIDMLDLIQRKTEGNRTDDESADLERMLHEMQMAYVSVSQKS